MLAKSEEVAVRAGCRKLTVEVQEEGVKSLPYCGVKI